MSKSPSILLLVVALCCFWLAGAWHQPLIAMRSAYRLDAVEPLENAPPLMALNTVVLICDTKLKEDLHRVCQRWDEMRPQQSKDSPPQGNRNHPAKCGKRTAAFSALNSNVDASSKNGHQCRLHDSLHVCRSFSHSHAFNL